jgi:hypothetical protein
MAHSSESSQTKGWDPASPTHARQPLNGGQDGRPAESSREAAQKSFRLAEGAMARTSLNIVEWQGALREARQNLKDARFLFTSAGVLTEHKPAMAELARRIAEADEEAKSRIEEGDALREKTKACGDYVGFLASAEEGWTLRAEVYGRTSEEVEAHVGEMVEVMNATAAHLTAQMDPDGSDVSAQHAWFLLQRAELLTQPGADVWRDRARRDALRAVSLSNLGCFLARRGRLLPALQRLHDALAIEARPRHTPPPPHTPRTPPLYKETRAPSGEARGGRGPRSHAPQPLRRPRTHASGLPAPQPLLRPPRRRPRPPV